MGFLSSLGNKISNAWKISTSFKPFFNRQSENLRFLKIFHYEVPKEITDIYLKLKSFDSEKYKSEIQTYESFPDLVNKHNDIVERIEKEVKTWNYDDLLSHPFSLEEQQINNYSEIVKLINSFTWKSDQYQSFVNEFIAFKNNREEICREYRSLDKYNKLFDFDSFDYIDLKTKRSIEVQSNSIINTFNRKKDFFYLFDKHTRIDSLIKAHNESYILKKQKDPLFDSINNRSLDDEQRKAVLTDEKSTLVVAGAGSGKTLTICGKVEYLLKEKHINPSDILLLSYSKNSADDLQTKINNINNKLTVGTFHKIGLDVLKETQQKSFMVEDQYKAIIETYFREEIKKRPHMLQTILTYYGLYLKMFFKKNHSCSI